MNTYDNFELVSITLYIFSLFVRAVNFEMASKRLAKKLEINMKFMGDFEPKRAKRNESKSIYNAAGRIRRTQQDVCDCLNNRCVGCHFPCGQCMSFKCGHKCRQNRDDFINEISIDGQTKSKTIYNPNFGEKKL